MLNFRRRMIYIINGIAIISAPIMVAAEIIILRTSATMNTSRYFHSNIIIMQFIMGRENKNSIEAAFSEW